MVLVVEGMLDLFFFLLRFLLITVHQCKTLIKGYHSVLTKF
jgi:hypothetical protein